MRSRLSRSAAAITLLLTMLTACTPPITATPAELSPEETVTVNAVIDGDTIDVDTTDGIERVRLIGIDTPEINRDGGEDDCYAQEARDALNQLVYGRPVELRADPTQADRDRYDRLLRHVYIDDQSIALELIRVGAGVEYTFNAPYIGQAEHQDTAEQARAQARGLWMHCTQ